MMRHSIVIAVVAINLLLTAHSASAQQEATMHFMNSLPQVVYNNPAFVPRYKFSIGLPGSSVFASYANNGFSYNDFAVKNGDSVKADLNRLYSRLKKKNYISTAVQVDILRISVKLSARTYFTWNVSVKEFNRLMIPKDLTGIFINGTASFIGGSASLSPTVEATAYIESAWGASYIVNKKLTIGGRFKLLKGGINATTTNSTINLAVADDYTLTATADINAKTSGVHSLDTSSFDMKKDWKNYTKNTGYAFDLGATYRVMDRLTLGLSLIDIGLITWKNDVYGYRLDPAKASYTFKGVDLAKILDGNGDYLKSEGDSISSKFKFKEGRIASYRTPLPAKMYFSGNYELRKNLTLGALLFAEQFRGRFSSGASVSLHKEFGRRLSTSLSYTITNNSTNNIGAGFSLNLAPFQLYVVGDNLLRAPYALATNRNLNSYINSTQYFNIRVGLNFVFGWDKMQEKQPYPKRRKKDKA